MSEDSFGITLEDIARFNKELPEKRLSKEEIQALAERSLLAAKERRDKWRAFLSDSMTVGQLIEKLKQYPLDLPVLFMDDVGERKIYDDIFDRRDDCLVIG